MTIKHHIARALALVAGMTSATITTAVFAGQEPTRQEPKRAAAPYNEAVSIVDGRRVVVLPPTPKHMEPMIQAKRPPGSRGSSSVRIGVETAEGLMDCSLYVYDPRVCAPSTFGTEVTVREWLVLRQGTWQVCVGRAAPQECKPREAFAFLPTVQE